MSLADHQPPARVAPPRSGGLLDPRFRPSEYGAALLGVAAAEVRRRTDAGQAPQVLELGTGSGVVLAGLLKAGAARGLGIELEADALAASRALVVAVGVAERAELRPGDLWQAVDGERFDLVVCNPPQFPSLHQLDDGRLPSWSWGGPDGRSAMDPLLRGIGRHLRAGGVAFVTHNAFIGMAHSEALLAAQGLACGIARSVTVLLSSEKARALPPGFLEAGPGNGLRSVGPHRFAEFHVLEVRHPVGSTPGAAA